MLHHISFGVADLGRSGRTGGRSFAYTTLAVAVDATGQPVWLAKLAGTETLGPDCNVEAISRRACAAIALVKVRGVP